MKNTDDIIEAIRKNIDSDDFQANADRYERMIWPKYLEEYTEIAEKLKAFANDIGIIKTDTMVNGGGKRQGHAHGQRYEKRTLSDLKTLAKSRGISGYGKMRKGELIACLRSKPTK